MDTTTDTIEAEERYSRRTRAAVEENETQPVLMLWFPQVSGRYHLRRRRDLCCPTSLFSVRLKVCTLGLLWLRSEKAPDHAQKCRDDNRQ